MSHKWPSAAVAELSPEDRAEISDIIACFGLIVDDDATLMRVHRALERVRARAKSAGG